MAAGSGGDSPYGKVPAPPQARFVFCPVPAPLELGQRVQAVMLSVLWTDALDGKDAATLSLPCSFENHEVGDIAEGEDEINGLCGEVVVNPIVIGERQEFHGRSEHLGRGGFTDLHERSGTSTTDVAYCDAHGQDVATGSNLTMAKGAHAKTMQQPKYRAMIDRRTGKIVGPVVPIDTGDWPYSELPPSEILWRYTDIWKFEDLLARSALYFSRPDKFKDPFEGRFSPANSAKMSPSDAAFYAAYRITLSANKEREAAQEATRHFVFISCWQREEKESLEMWNAYTSGPESVVIATSAKALYRFVPGRIVKSPVKYHRDDFPRTEFGPTALFFYKPLRYSFEHEFRMLLTAGDNESVSWDDPADFGRHVPITLKKIVHRVITHPRASNEFKAKVDELMRKHLKHREREDSALLP
jgi:hypothetical protein